MKFSRILICTALILSGVEASARVFNFAGLNVSSFLRAAGGTAQFGNDAFSNSAAQDVSYSEGALYQFTGEFGFSFEADAFTARLGFELHRPQHLTQYEAKTSGGTIQYTVDSDIISYSPTLTLEFPLNKAQTTKSYFFLGVGYAYVTLSNIYTFTASGSSYGLSNFTEDGKTQSIFGTGGWGFETLMVDNVTFGMEFGYRFMEAYQFNHKSNVTTFLGSKTEGSVMKNSDGSDRFLNLSQPFLAFVLRFYI